MKNLSNGALLLLVCTNIYAGTITVGSDVGSCDYTDLQDALNATRDNGPEADLIALAKNGNFANQNFIIEDQNLSLIGGYTDCSLSTLDGHTEISAVGLGPAGSIFNIASTGAPAEYFRVEFVNIEMSGASAGVIFNGGAIELNGRVSLVVDNSRFISNTGYAGGAMKISADGNGTVVIRDSHFEGNRAVFQNQNGGIGGAIFCGPGVVNETEVTFEGNNSFVGNEADASGGAYFARGCQTTREGAMSFSSNSALSNDNGLGGAITLIAGAQWSDSSNTGALLFENNFAAFSGGAIALGGVDTIMRLTGATFESNEASGLGGAIFVEENARLMAQADNFPMKCKGNQAFGGGCVAGFNRADISLNSALIEQNIALGGAGILLSGFAQAHVDTVQITDNSSVVFASENSTLEMYYATIADNQDTSFRLFDNSTVLLRSSIVTDFNNDAGMPYDLGEVDQTSSFSQDCVLSMSDVGLDIGFRGVSRNTKLPDGFTTEELYQDINIGNYRLDDTVENHFAIDYCDDDNPPINVTHDLDGKARGYDHPEHMETFGSYDVGAYENRFDSDVIFADNFR